MTKILEEDLADFISFSIETLSEEEIAAKIAQQEELELDKYDVEEDY